MESATPNTTLLATEMRNPPSTVIGGVVVGHALMMTRSTPRMMYTIPTMEINVGYARQTSPVCLGPVVPYAWSH